MSDFAGAYGDKRRAAAVARLFDGIVDQNSLVIRRVGINRRGEIAAHRVLSSPQVTPQETVKCLTHHTAGAVAGRRIVVAQDTTEVNFPGRQSRGLGPAGNRHAACTPSPGFFIHAAVAIDADTDTVLGLVEAEIWTRETTPPTDRHTRTFEEKESQRWLRGAETAGDRLGAASEIIVVGDRESDIYALFSRRPDNVQLLVRAAQNRALDDGTMLFDAADTWPIQCTYTVKVPPRKPGDVGREATVAVRANRVALRHPRNGRREGDPQCVELTLVDAREIDPKPGIEPLHWRLLSTLPARTADEAVELVRLYRLRWRIEQTFRMLKSQGLCLEDVQTADPHRLFNLAALAAGAAVRIIQLVDARDGSSRPASDVATAEQISAAAALCPSLEGKTERQRNPHPAGSLAWMSWIIARLGGWNCYYKPPGPKTMRDGWQRFAAIAEGFGLARQAQNV